VNTIKFRHELHQGISPCSDYSAANLIFLCYSQCNDELKQGWPNFLDRGPFAEIWTIERNLMIEKISKIFSKILPKTLSKILLKVL